MAVFNDIVTTTVNVEANQAINQMGKLQSEVRNLSKNMEGLRKGTKAYVEESQKLKNAQESLNQLREKMGLTGMTMRQLKQYQRELNAEISNLTRGTPAYEALKHKIQEVNKVLKDQQNDIKEVGKALRTVRGFDVFDNISGLLKGGAILGIATQVFSVAKEFFNLTDQVNKSKNALAQFSGLTGTALDDSTAKARAIAETFGKDFNEVLTASNALSKSMGISFEESLTLIQSGFVKGADLNNDFLDKVKEYPTQFKEAGFSANQFIQLAIQEPKSGIFSDKLLDTIKEVGLSLREMTKAQRDALTNAFGSEFANKLANDLDKGKITTAQALQFIQSEALKTGLSVSQAQTLTADLFKGAGEDAGGFAKILEVVNQGLASNVHQMTEAEQATLANAQASEAYNKALVQLSANFQGWGSSVSNFFKGMLTEAINFVNRWKMLISGDYTIESLNKTSQNASTQDINRNYEKVKQTIIAQQKELAELRKKENNQENQGNTFALGATKANIKTLEKNLNLNLQTLENYKNSALKLAQEKASTEIDIETKKTSAINKLAKPTVDKERQKWDLEDKQKKILEEITDLLAQPIQKEVKLDIDVKINKLDTEAINKKIDENLQKSIDKKNRNAKANANNAVLDAQDKASTNSLFGDNSKAVINAKLAELTALKSIELQNKELTESEKSNIEKRYNQQRTQSEQAGLEARTMAIIDVFSQAYNVIKQFNEQRFANEMNQVTSEKDNRLAVLEKEKQEELAKYQGNKDKQQQINQKYESAKAGIESNFAKQSADIKTRQAKAEKAGKIFEAILSTAAAVVKALPNIPLSVIAGVIGAAQIAIIASQPIPDYSASTSAGSDTVTGGYYEGGFTPKRNKNSTPVGIVHANEYVIPARLLAMPEVYNYASMIEGLRVGKRGFQEGGFTSPPPYSPEINSAMLQAIKQINILIAVLNNQNSQMIDLLSAPMRAYVVAQDIKDNIEELDRIDDESRFG
jgi:hypothetical protein